MVDPQLLHAVTADALTRAFPRYDRQINTADARTHLHRELVYQVSQKISEPFEIEIIDHGNGTLSVDARPVMTAAEAKAEAATREREIREAEAHAVSQAIERAAQRPSRAAVMAGQDGAPHVSIAGMIEDLRHWQTPPDLFESEPTGFRRALDDIERYLRTRARTGPREG